MLLKELRKTLCLSQEELAERVGVTPLTYWRWENGRQHPQRAQLRRLSQILGVAPEELDGQDAVDEALELASAVETSDIGSDLVETTQEAVERLRRRYSSVPSSELASELRFRLKLVGRLLKGRMTFRQHRDLLQAAGWLALLRGTVAWDRKQRDEAYVYRDLAWQWSRQTGDQELEAWALETPAWYALIDKRFRDSVELSQAAQQRLPESYVAVASLLQEGRGWARLGARSESLSAIRKASALLERLGPPAHIDDHYAVDPSKLDFIAGTCLAVLGVSREAEEHARRVIADNDPGGKNYWPARVAIAHIDLGLALSQRGEWDEAAAEGAQAFGSPVCHRSTMQRAGELAKVLAVHPEVSEVRDYQERYELAQAAGIP